MVNKKARAIVIAIIFIIFAILSVVIGSPVLLLFMIVLIVVSLFAEKVQSASPNTSIFTNTNAEKFLNTMREQKQSEALLAPKTTEKINPQHDLPQSPSQPYCEAQTKGEPEFCHNEHYTKAMTAHEMEKELAELKSLYEQGFMDKQEYDEKRFAIISH